MIRVLCAEDDPLVRDYLVARTKLTPDVRVVAVAENVREALAYLAGSEVDVLLADYRMRGGDGTLLLDALRLARQAADSGHRFPAVLFCTGLADSGFEQEARAAGAVGVVRKERTAAELVPAIRAVAAGRSWFQTAPAEPAPAGARVPAAPSSATGAVYLRTPRSPAVRRTQPGALAPTVFDPETGFGGGTFDSLA